MKIKFTKEDTTDILLDIKTLSDTLDDTLLEWEQHPRRLTCLRDAENTTKEVLDNIKTLRKLYDKKVK